MKITKIETKYKIITPIRKDKWLGLGIRGVLGEKLKLNSCGNLKKKCDFCKNRDKCAYYQLYELGKDPFRKIVSSMPPPRQWVLKNINENKYLSFDIYIFQKNPWFIGMIENALSKITQLGAFKNSGYGKIKLEKIKKEKIQFKRLKYIKNRIRVEFKTPTQIITKGIINLKPSLYDILVNAGRKYYIIKHLYYNEKNQLNNLPKITNIKDISKIKIIRLKKESFYRFSHKRKRKEKIEGILGSITYEIKKPKKELKNLIEEILGFANLYGIGKRTNANLGEVRITSY